jgi:ABC-type sugar transport system ATPase subunit
MTQSDTILDIQDLSKAFPGVQALDAVSFSIERGQIHSIVGENGAGKSTLTKIITGIHQRDAGVIQYDGRAVDYRTIYQSIEDNMYLVFQELSLCPNLTVAENIFLGKLGLKFPGSRGFVNKRRVFSEAAAHLSELNIDVPVEARVGDLEVAQQQLVEIAKALVIRPKLLILDEPTSALTDDEVKNLFSLMERLRGEGVTIILISHIIDDVFSISDTITVLRDGRHVATRPKADLSVAEIVRLMVGRDIHQIEVGQLDSDEELLRVE